MQVLCGPSCGTVRIETRRATQRSKRSEESGVGAIAGGPQRSRLETVSQPVELSMNTVHAASARRGNHGRGAGSRGVVGIDRIPMESGPPHPPHPNGGNAFKDDRWCRRGIIFVLRRGPPQRAFDRMLRRQRFDVRVPCVRLDRSGHVAGASPHGARPDRRPRVRLPVRRGGPTPQVVV